MRDNDMRMPALLLLLQLLPFAEATSSNVSFVPGAICSDVNPANPARSLLQGKHLRMYELEWPPFASRDATAPHGWVGYDIDMIVAVAEFLGFTFEIHEAQQLTGETYTETLIRTANDVDLWLSWWLRDKYRMNFTIMLAGHVDAAKPQRGLSHLMKLKLLYILSLHPLQSLHSFCLRGALPPARPGAAASPSARW